MKYEVYAFEIPPFKGYSESKLGVLTGNLKSLGTLSSGS
jgi:hypothetical protein